LRFAPPQPVDPWSQPRRFTQFGPQCVQPESMLNPPGQQESEDCLTLNVWAPESALNAAVMVWIHGGSFTSGSGALSWYDGAALASRGVVVVTLNYRLGALGFLHLGGIPGETANGLDHAANLGLQDQAAALKWVHDNIAAVGGDPRRVTIFGESAGAMSVGAHLVSPASAGLFSRAILQSGTPAHSHGLEAAAAVRVAVLESMVGSDDTDLRVLQAIEVRRFIEADAAANAVARTAALPLPFQPVRDGLHLPVDPRESIRDGACAQIPLLVGANRDEMRLFSLGAAMAGTVPSEETLLRRAKRMLESANSSSQPAELLARYREVSGHDGGIDLWSALATDAVFRLHALDLAESQAAAGGQVWHYSFEYASEAFGGLLGAAHALEIPFAFDNLHQRGISLLLGEVTEEMSRLATGMADAWVSFAQGQSPRLPGGDPWPAFSQTTPTTAVLGVESSLTTTHLDEVRDLWTSRG
ncbi:MAG TPA: carboxylesterase, partial [Acidimicrobiaceae bacterium]|nr:carboxylesterase [Acidimicrobiaceae bacterium]